MLLGGLLLACFSMGASAAALLGDGGTFTAAGQDWQDGGWAATGAPFTDTATFILNTPLTIKVTFSTTKVGGLPGSGVLDTGFGLMDISGSGGVLVAGELAGPADFKIYTLHLLAGTYGTLMQSLGGVDPIGGSYSVSAVSSVPVPGAAILFGSAIMAFGFISRRRKGITA